MSNVAKVFVAAGLAALARAVAPVAEAQPPIRIGTSLAQSRVYAALGQNQLRGYQLCVKHANEKGGVLGRKIELIAEDNRSEPANTVAIYERPVAQDRVAAVFSPGAREFVEAYRKEFPGAELSNQPAAGYGACQIVLQGIRRAGSLDGERIREAILKVAGSAADA